MLMFDTIMTHYRAWCTSFFGEVTLLYYFQNLSLCFFTITILRKTKDSLIFNDSYYFHFHISLICLVVHVYFALRNTKQNLFVSIIESAYHIKESTLNLGIVIEAKSIYDMSFKSSAFVEGGVSPLKLPHWGAVGTACRLSRVYWHPKWYSYACSVGRAHRMVKCTLP